MNYRSIWTSNLIGWRVLIFPKLLFLFLDLPTFLEFTGLWPASACCCQWCQPMPQISWLLTHGPQWAALLPCPRWPALSTGGTVYKHWSLTMAVFRHLARQGLRILPLPMDGHCLLHSVCSSWKSQVSQLKPIDLDTIKMNIFTETTNNADKYLGLSITIYLLCFRVSDYILFSVIINQCLETWSLISQLMPCVLIWTLSMKNSQTLNISLLCQEMVQMELMPPWLYIVKADIIMELVQSQSPQLLYQWEPLIYLTCRSLQISQCIQHTL